MGEMPTAASPSIHTPIYLAGPTAVGKSSLALKLAERLNGEIVSVDSMQVYQGMDIGTAKPSATEQNQIRHHLLNIVPVRHSFDVHQFLEHARTAVRHIENRGHRPIFCGGTGLYFKAYREGLDPLPGSDPTLRQKLESELLESLLEELKQVDPKTYDCIDRQNPRRVIRALEIIRLTGEQVSTLRKRGESTEPETLPSLIVLSRSPETLRTRIESRVDHMFETGLVEEVDRLLTEGINDNPTARQALGYRQVIDHLRSNQSLEQTITAVKTKTWQFARRQQTWFRKQPKTYWLDADTLSETELVEKVITHHISAATDGMC